MSCQDTSAPRRLAAPATACRRVVAGARGVGMLSAAARLTQSRRYSTTIDMGDDGFGTLSARD
eukprot:2736081-Prymnesium_polylepis.1